MSKGSVKRSGDGWMFVVDMPSADGRRRQIKRRGFTRKADATAALERLLAEAERGTPVDPSRLTVGVYLTDQWLPALQARNLRATTLDTYQRLVRRHLVPLLGAVRLQALDMPRVERMLAELAAAGLSPKSRRNIHGVLSKALSDAQRWGLVSRNAASDAELPRAARPKARAWSAAQVARLLDHVQGDRLEPLWRVVVVLGCRRGEALGLRWSDIDWDRGLVSILNQRTIAGGTVVQNAPKTAAGERTVALDPATLAMLRTWRSQQAAEYLALGVRPTHGLVFTAEDGRPLWPQRVTARFRAISDELGLPRIGVHGLRHSAGTWMISAGVNPKVVAQRLGHANVSVTLGLYNHVMPGHDQAAADAFASALASAARERCDQTVTTEA